MKFSKYDSISSAGNKVNEDIVYVTDNYGWVIDGATGLNNKNLTGSSSDANWFVNEWDKYLKENISNNSVSIKEIIFKGIGYISNKFYQITTSQHFEKVDFPSASIVVIRIKSGKIEYFLLGDCTLIVQDNNGKSLILKQDLLDKLDNKAKVEMSKLMVKEGMSFVQARQSINSLLVKHRLLKNTPNGYWTLEFDEKAVENSLCGCFDFLEYKKVLLMSDGFSAIFDNYDYFKEDNIISIVEKQGLQDVYRILRIIEEEDSDILRFPRFKKGDDASAVILSR
jgi:serine/threonine protein phosphatase PrpC